MIRLHPSVLAVPVVILVLVLLLYHRPAVQSPPAEATCRQLAENPAEYEGRKVMLSTAGCQREGAGRYVWRDMASQPPKVVVLFSGEAPIPLPKVVAGTCQRQIQGGPLVVWVE